MYTPCTAFCVTLKNVQKSNTRLGYASMNAMKKNPFSGFSGPHPAFDLNRGRGCTGNLLQTAALTPSPLLLQQTTTLAAEPPPPGGGGNRRQSLWGGKVIHTFQDSIEHMDIHHQGTSRHNTSRIPDLRR